jgi:CopG family nickel-responsive transcriptional regulator
MKHGTNGGVSRFSVSLHQGLLRDLDVMVREKGYSSRSLAIADMVRDRLVEHRRWRGRRRAIVGTITLVYDHHRRRLQSLLTAIGHDHEKAIISTVHVHLDHDHCLEVLLVRGPAEEVQEIADRLGAARGMKHVKLTVTSSGKDMAG